MSDPSLNLWKNVGLIATVLIVLSTPVYLVKERHRSAPSAGLASVTAAFVGSTKCQSCHKPEYDKWQASHHRYAMALATQETVLGDFNDASFEHLGVKSRFYRRDGKYFVHTQGPGGGLGEFEITHTFGWYPLQQYLIPFPGGRLQCLPIAWDLRKKQWYHLYPDRPPDPQDWLYWTNQAQNWNGMCAECHSTNLKKNYDLTSDTFGTTWSEISVGCEACHGPGSEHVKWAELPEMGRPPTRNYGLAVRTRGLSPREQIELCAPCHSRRMSLGDNPHANMDFLDYAIPQLLTEGHYFADGQILEEVYVYGSFMQSKMYDRGIRCSDCHDVHSIKRIREGNDLCIQCHKAAVYDTKDHHFHKKKGEKGEPIRSSTGEVLFEVGDGARCEQCHMPGRVYMGVDYRPDHSLRIPRPDLTEDIKTPNACDRCHVDKGTRWSLEAMAKWYGQRKRSHYGTVLAAGRERAPGALPDLVRLAQNRLYPTIVRATALSMVAAYPGKETEQAFLRALSDEAALMRYTALRYLPEGDPRLSLPLAAPLLYDPVKAVRTEAARFLTTVPPGVMTGPLRIRFQAVLEEYRQAMAYTADFPFSRHNLGNLYSNLGQRDLAVQQYLKAIQIDREFFPAKVNLAMVYNREGKNEQARQLLTEVMTAHPDLHEVAYSLGLLLVEMKQYNEAVVYLEKAARGMPERGRIHYNLGLLLQQMKRDKDAESALLKAVDTEPENMDFLYALAQFYLNTGKPEKAWPIAEKMARLHPNQRIGQDLLTHIDRMLKSGRR